MEEKSFGYPYLKISEEFKQIFQLSWPVMVGMILQSLLGTVDVYFISSLGTSEAAAASLGNSAAGVIFVMSTLVSAGAVALVARSMGEKNEEAVKRISGEAILLSTILGAILSIVCYMNTENIIKIMFHPEAEVLKLSSEFLGIIFLGTVFVFLNSTLRTIVQALGDTMTPLFIFGIANVINGVLDVVLIFGLKWGIKGAAVATVTATIFSFIAINYILIKKIYSSKIEEFLKYFKVGVQSSLRILKIGGWACIQQVARPLTGMAMFRIVGEVGGKVGTAAFGIGGQLFNYTFIFLVGLSVAVSIMVGQSLGRKDLKNAEVVIQEGMKFAVVNMIIFAIPYLIFPEWVMHFFISDGAVVKTGAEYLRIVYLGLFFVIYPTIYGGVFQGAGDNFPPMISSLIANVVLKLPLAYVLALYFKMGTNGVWFSIALSVVIEAVIIYVYFKKGKWKEKEI